MVCFCHTEPVSNSGLLRDDSCILLRQASAPCRRAGSDPFAVEEVGIHQRYEDHNGQQDQNSGSDQPMKLITMKRTPHRTHRKPASRWVRFQFSSLLRVQGSRMPRV